MPSLFFVWVDDVVVLCKFLVVVVSCLTYVCDDCVAFVFHVTCVAHTLVFLPRLCSALLRVIGFFSNQCIVV